MLTDMSSIFLLKTIKTTRFIMDMQNDVVCAIISSKFMKRNASLLENNIDFLILK